MVKRDEAAQSRVDWQNEGEEEEKLIGLPFHFVNSLWKLNINNPGRVSCLLCKTLYVVRKNLCSIRFHCGAEITFVFQFSTFSIEFSWTSSVKM